MQNWMPLHLLIRSVNGVSTWSGLSDPVMHARLTPAHAAALTHSPVFKEQVPPWISVTLWVASCHSACGSVSPPSVTAVYGAPEVLSEGP